MATVERPPQSQASSSDPFAGWGSVPLFMQSLPPEQGGQPRRGAAPAVVEENNTLDALQALMYEGNPSEIAADLKTQANELFAKKKYRDAIGFYTRAIDEVGKELPIEEMRVLWCNRAAANLELGNFGATLRDASLVLSAPLSSYPEPPSTAHHKTTLKALLRSARALSALEKLPEALDALERLQLVEVEISEQDKDVGGKMRVEVTQKINKKEKKEAETKERARRKVEGEKRMREALKLRGVILPKSTAKNLFSSCPIDITPPHFDPSALPPFSSPDLPLSPASSSPAPFVTWVPPPAMTPLIFPVFLLLPLATPPTRDLCLEFHSSSTFGEAVRAMEHDPATLQVYISTAKGKVLKIGAKLELGRVLDAASKDGDGWEMKEGWALEMVGVPKTVQGENWIATWKEEVKLGANSLL